MKKEMNFKSFYEKNVFFSWLISTILLIIIMGTLYFLLFDGNPDYDNAARVWEVSSYIMTLTYTLWYWIFTKEKKRGRDIRKNRLKKDGDVFWDIAWSVIFIILLTFYHILFFVAYFAIHFFNSPLKFNGVDIKVFMFSFSGTIGVINLVLLYLSYVLFCRIAKTVSCNIDIECADDETRKDNIKIKQDIENGLSYIDNPTRIVFLILTIFAIIIWIISLFSKEVTYYGIQIFFCGAIAFELILSAISWANTDTA